MSKTIVIRIVVALFVTLFSAIVIVIPQVSAKPITTHGRVMPLASCGTLECNSYSVFDDGTSLTGADSDWTYGMPHLFDCTGSNCFWSQYMILETNRGDQTHGSVIVGFERSKNRSYGVCGSSSNTVYYVDAAYASDGIVENSRCVSANSPCQPIVMTIRNYVSNGGGIQVMIYDCNGTLLFKEDNPYSLGVLSHYRYVEQSETILSNVIDNPSESLQNITFLDYETTGGVYNWQTNTITIQSSDNPPQWYWYSLPNGQSNYGGILYHCIYNTGTTC